MHRSFLFIGNILAVLAATVLLAADPDTLQVGVPDSLVKDLSIGSRKILELELTKLIYEYTGFQNKMHQGGDVPSAVKKLENGDWRLAILQGIEFAWAQEQDPRLKPLMVAYSRERVIRAALVVKKDSPVKAFDGLQGKSVNVQSKLHCRLFADKEGKGNAAQFFGKLLTVHSSEDALDNILLGKVEAAIVDHGNLKSYAEVQPGRFNRLLIVIESEPFPPGAIVYREGMLSDGLLKKFRDGMLKANNSEKAREVMNDFQIASFEDVPKDFPQILGASLKAYPRPSGASK